VHVFIFIHENRRINPVEIVLARGRKAEGE
jgi:hypothetical protein